MFADNTNLFHCLCQMEPGSIDELGKTFFIVDDWFEANKLSLNFDHLLGAMKEDEINVFYFALKGK